MTGLPAGDVRLNQTFELDSQLFKRIQHGLKVPRRYPLEASGSIGDAGDLIQIPTDDTECADRASEFCELTIGEWWDIAEVSAYQHRNVCGPCQSASRGALAQLRMVTGAQPHG